MYARALSHSCQDVGRTIKRTKQKHVWEFDFELSEYEAEKHEVILYYSVVSGKRQIYLDGEKISSCVGQYGNLQMKFLIDKYKNAALIQVDSDGKYTLLINNVKFKDLYQAPAQGDNKNKLFVENKSMSQTATNNTAEIQKKRQRQRSSLKEYNLKEDASDEDTKNHISLVEDRYINSIPNGNTKGNPQLFDGPIVKLPFNQEITKRLGTRFKSFGLDNGRNEESSPDKSYKNNSNITKDIEPCPFFGQNFDSQLVNDLSNGKHQQQQSPSKPQQQQQQDIQILQSLSQTSPNTQQQQSSQQSQNISQETKQSSIVMNNPPCLDKDNISGVTATISQDVQQQRSITFGVRENIQNLEVSDQNRTTTMTWPLLGNNQQC